MYFSLNNKMMRALHSIAAAFMAVAVAFCFIGCGLIDGGSTDKPQADPYLYIVAQTATVEVGGSITLKTQSNESAPAMLWLSDAENIATVTDGVVTGVNVGTARITAFTEDAVATIDITVTEKTAPSVFILAAADMQVEVGGTLVLTATAASGAEITWESSNPVVATVENGTVVGKGEGKTLITASALGATAECVVTVTAPSSGAVPIVILNKTSLSLKTGDSEQLVASAGGATVYWFSTNESVIRVVDGNVVALSVGAARVFAVTNKAVATCDIVVTAGTVKPPVTVTLNQSSAKIKVGSTYTLVATVSDGSPVTWQSSHPSIASVSNGVVTAHAVGTAIIIAIVDGDSATCSVQVEDPDDPAYKAGYTLVWRDEFDGSSLDTSKWGYQTGTKDIYAYAPEYWGNSELQYYTEDAVSVTGGNLVITAKKQQMGDRNYTSGRIITRGKYFVTYGYVEARIKLPKGSGMWPAFWMLPEPLSSNPADGSGNEYGGWASSGEIDIMEAKGRLLNQVDTTIHYGGGWPNNKFSTKSYTMSSDIDEWHTYAVDWRDSYIAWEVDGKEVYRVKNDVYYSDSSSNPSAPFDKPFYILFNFAVGGSYDPTGTDELLAANSFTQASMLVDYVRVYKPIQ